jgi:class 3 adenylate cyclase
VEVVILFSDLRGFSTFAEGQDPAVVVERLNAYLERMVEAIEAEQGVVDKFIGDAIMAIFGGLVKLDNPCASAVRAARRMRDNLSALNQEWEGAGIESFDNGIGIHVGDVLQGPIGSPQRKEFTAIGDAVNTAARLEDQTKRLGVPVLITGAVHQRLGSDEQGAYRALGEITVKGLARPLTVYGSDK